MLRAKDSTGEPSRFRPGSPEDTTGLRQPGSAKPRSCACAPLSAATFCLPRLSGAGGDSDDGTTTAVPTPVTGPGPCRPPSTASFSNLIASTLSSSSRPSNTSCMNPNWSRTELYRGDGWMEQSEARAVRKCMGLCTRGRVPERRDWPSPQNWTCQHALLHVVRHRTQTAPCTRPQHFVP